jgi:predicted TIM-barrel fold metal-dependent hydrolase
MLKIDVHIHFNGDHPDCLKLLERLDLKLLNVCVAHDSSGRWRTAAHAYRQLSDQHPERYAWCTTFDPPELPDADYAERVIDGLERDPDAVGCKMWKNIGMDVQTPSGAYLMVDDPLFDPIYEYLTKVDRTLLMHLGEPLACWHPLDPEGPHYWYYKSHPEWHMYGRSGVPSHGELIDARDRVLARHPKLRVVGAHLGSLEYDVSEIARRLDLYPNLAVDTSARTKDLARQDSDVVRQFFLRYPNRILFGTDLVFREPQSSLSQAARTANLLSVHDRFEAEFLYYESQDTLEMGGREVQGLGLPPGVLASFYHDNAADWYPGIC